MFIMLNVQREAEQKSQIAFQLFFFLNHKLLFSIYTIKCAAKSKYISCMQFACNSDANLQHLETVQQKRKSKKRFQTKINMKQKQLMFSHV